MNNNDYGFNGLMVLFQLPLCFPNSCPKTSPQNIPCSFSFVFILFYFFLLFFSAFESYCNSVYLLFP